MSNKHRSSCNRFDQLDRDELWKAAQATWLELSTPKKRSPQERLSLADDARHLLQALSRMLHEGPGDPAYMMKYHGQTVDFAFWDRYQRDLGNIRNRALYRAAEVVLGNREAAIRWCRGHWHHLAWNSDEGLKKGLQQLEGIRLGLRSELDPP